MSAEVAMGPRNHHGVQDVTAVNVLANFYPLIDENQRGLTGGEIPAQTITDVGFCLCSTMADVPGASVYQLLF